MSKSLSSPTARLLQSSRIFSLPRPLPPPALETATSTGSYRASDTATTPYPTHQAIATPASSHFRGDWGLKRPLPKKTTASSTPHIRIKAQDNTQHITDFESAADHTQTEAKWQQMGVPIVIKPPRDTASGFSKGPRHSAYDEHLDHTDPDFVDQTSNDQRGPVSKRWKFRGPWIGGMQEGEFQLYLARQVSKRKDEFHAFLSKRILENRIAEEQRVAREQGQTTSITPARREQLRRDIARNYDQEIQTLRDDQTASQLGSELAAAICEFLDLPATRPGDSNQFSTVARSRSLQDSLTKTLGSADAGPPTTHPAAGLSHLRTAAWMENHPLHGPQAARSPVLARVVRTRNNVTQAAEQLAQLGVGGIVTSDTIRGSFTPPTSSDPAQRYLDANSMTDRIDATLVGGNKIWVQPGVASINERGHILLDVSRSEREAIAVKEGEVEHVHEARRSIVAASSGGYGAGALAAPGTAGNANYGKALPGRVPRERNPGFDDSAAAEIRKLLPGRMYGGL